MCIGSCTYAQKSTLQVEKVIFNDSLKTVIYNSITEGCKKLPIKMRVENKACPVFIDEEGFMFFITIDNGYIAIVDIDMD